MKARRILFAGISIFSLCLLAGTADAHAGTISGTISYSGTSTGKVIIRAAQTLPGNKALTLDGVDDYVSIDSLRDLSGSELSIGYWFRGNSIQSAVRQQSSGFIIAGWNNLHVVSNDGGTGGISVGPGYNDGNWHHLLFTWKRATTNGFASYLDGRLVTSRDSGNSAIPNLNTPVLFGSLGGVAEFADGKFDEITIWRRALTPTEVQENWNKKYTGEEEGLAGYWSFDDDTLNDSSPAAHPGFAFGGAFLESHGIPGLGGGIAKLELPAPGAFSISDLPDGDGYLVTGFLDINGNGRQDADEPFGAYSTESFTLDGTKGDVNFALAGAPSITSQPIGGRFAAGAAVKLAVAAQGVGTIGYTWMKNDEPLSDGGRISGSRSAELTLTGVTIADTGVYSVSVSNLVGAVTSQAVAVLVVSGGATVSGQITYPGSQTGKLHVLLAQRKGGNKVLKLDGQGDTVATTVTDLSGAEMTIQYWFKGSNPTSVVRQQAGGYVVSGWNGLHILSHDKGTTGISMGQGLTDGGWHHVIITWKQGAAGGFASYLDGKLVTKRDASTSPIPNHNAQVYFGSLNNSGEFMNGMVDEIAIWNRALSASEIAANWSLTLVGNEAGLMGYWDFNDGAAIDRTANQNNGDLLGDAVILTQEIPTLGSFYPLVVETGTSFQFENIPLGHNYFITAFIDANGNGVQDPAEPAGTLSENQTSIAGDLTAANFVLNESPRISSEPSPRRAGPGESVRFDVTALGTAPLTYQWFKDGIEITSSGRITGTTSGQLSINAVETGDAGIYSVLVQNPQGQVVSRSVELVVAPGGVSVSGEIRYNGTLPGRVVVKAERFKPGNKALKLDGDGDFVTIPSITNLSGDALTIAFWFKGSVVQSAVRQQGTGYIIAGWNGMHIISTDGGTGGIPAGNITDGNWHFVTLTWAIGTQNGYASYLDGLPVAARDSAAEPLPNTGAQLYFGALNGGGEFANGLIDEIAIWNRALTAAEVRDVSRTILTGAETGLIGFWNFDSGNAADLSPNSHHGTFAGDAVALDTMVSGLGGGIFLDEFSTSGAFTLDHIPAGANYYLTAFIDENGDLNPNVDETAISFSGNPVDLSANRTGVILDFDGPGPSLSVVRIAGGVRISWPVDVTGFGLESTPSLSPAEWSPVQGAANNEVTVTPDGEPRFFRLKKP